MPPTTVSSPSPEAVSPDSEERKAFLNPSQADLSHSSANRDPVASKNPVAKKSKIPNKVIWNILEYCLEDALHDQIAVHEGYLAGTYKYFERLGPAIREEIRGMPWNARVFDRLGELGILEASDFGKPAYFYSERVLNLAKVSDKIAKMVIKLLKIQVLEQKIVSIEIQKQVERERETRRSTAGLWDRCMDKKMDDDKVKLPMYMLNEIQATRSCLKVMLQYGYLGNQESLSWMRCVVTGDLGRAH